MRLLARFCGCVFHGRPEALRPLGGAPLGTSAEGTAKTVLVVILFCSKEEMQLLGFNVLRTTIVSYIQERSMAQPVFARNSAGARMVVRGLPIALWYLAKTKSLFRRIER